MNRNKLLGSAVAAALWATSVPTFSATPTTIDIPTTAAEQIPTAWFVQFKSKPGKSNKRAMNAERTEFKKAAQAAGFKYSERRNFDALWNGISIDATAGTARQLKGLSSVSAVFPVIQMTLPATTANSSPDLLSALEMTGADIAQNSLGLTGAGIKVGVIDSGIDIDHPDLGGTGTPGGTGFPTNRIAYGWDFVGDDYNADPSDPAYNPVPSPDENPDDCGGHGTHVAGIVGASGSVTGVAPDVTFGAYRVFGCDGSTDTDIILEAMEMAHADGMDIINMSLGASFTWPQYPTAVAASNLVDEGTIVVASIGNSGASGLYSAGAPGLGENVIGVASIDNTMVLSNYFEVDGAPVSYLPMTYAGPVPESGMEDYVWIGRACVGDALEGDPNGKTALIRRGACSFSEKATNAIAAGATAVVIANNADGNFGGTLGAPIDGTTPVVSVSGEDGDFMIAAAVQQLTWSDQLLQSVNPTGGLVSDFSSYGLAPDLTLKPDIAAPGGSIYSTYPLEQDGYATLGGTSMSSPHVAGAAALVLEARPGTPAMEMRPLLQNSADPALLTVVPAPGLLEPVHHQGAGNVDIDASILADVLVTPGKISMGEGEIGPQVHQLTLRNDGDEDVTFDIYDEQAIATSGLTDVLGFYFGDQAIAFSHEQVTVPAGGSETITAMIYPATIPDADPDQGFLEEEYGIYGGYILFLPVDDSGEPLRVPYAGFVGDYQRIQHIGPSAFGVLPILLNQDYTVPGDEDFWTFTMEDGNLPHFLFHFDHQMEYFEAVIYDATAEALVHPVFNKAFVEEYLPRNGSDDTFFDFVWDATRFHSNGQGNAGKRKDVPNGRYVLEFRGLKANGDPTNADHWETWMSPVFRIERPEEAKGNGKKK